MIIKSIELNNWRKINNLKLEFKDDINIIYGENESGKSTIREAIKFAFFERADSEKKETKNIIPWGKDLKPSVSLTFVSKKNLLFQIEKSFPKGISNLYLLKEKDKEKIAEEKGVNKKILEILEIDEKVSPLFDILWLNQGNTFSIFNSNELKSIAIQAEIKNIIKENIVSKKDEEFYNYICEKYNVYFTEKRNQFKNDILQINEEYSKIKKEISEKEEKIAELAKDKKILEQTTSSLIECEKEINNIKNEEKSLEEKRQNINFIESFNQIRNKYEKIISLNNENTHLKDEIKNLLKKLKFLLEVKYKEKKALIEENRIKLTEQQELKNLLSTFKVKEERTISDIEILKKEIENIETQINLNKLTVEITPISLEKYSVKIADKTYEHHEKSKNVFSSDGQIEIFLNDIANIKVNAPIPKEKLSFLNDELKLKKKKLNEIYNNIGKENINDIKKEYEEYKNNLEYYKMIEKELIRVDLKREEIELKNIEEEIKAIKEESDKSINIDNLDISIQNLKNKINEKKSKNISNIQTIEALLEGQEIKDLENKFLNMQKELQTKQESFSYNKEESEKIDRELKSLKTRRDNLEDKLKKLNYEKAQLEAKIKFSNSIYIDKAKNENKFVEIKTKRKKILTDALSIKLLKELIEEEKRNLDQNLIIPLQNKIGEKFKQITNEAYEAVVVEKDMRIDYISKKNILGDITKVNIDEISFGTKEQLSLLFRIAIGEFLSTKEKILMILDDNLVNTDEKRINHFFDIIESNKEKIQFLIFTCKKDDYKRFLDKYNFIDLNKI